MLKQPSYRKHRLACVSQTPLYSYTHILHIMISIRTCLEFSSFVFRFGRLHCWSALSHPAGDCGPCVISLNDPNLTHFTQNKNHCPKHLNVSDTPHYEISFIFYPNFILSVKFFWIFFIFMNSALSLNCMFIIGKHV